MSFKLPLHDEALVAIANLIGGDKGRVLIEMRPNLQGKYAPQLHDNVSDVAFQKELPIAPRAGGEDLWVIRERMIELCKYRHLSLTPEVLQQTKDEFMAMYRMEARNMSATLDCWQVMHLYGVQRSALMRDSEWMHKLPPAPPAAEQNTEPTDNENCEGQTENDSCIDTDGRMKEGIKNNLGVDTITTTTKGSTPAPEGTLFVFFRDHKLTLSTISALADYIVRFSITCVDLYFERKQGKVIQDAIADLLSGVRVQQFAYGRRRHRALTQHALSPANVRAMTVTEQQAFLKTKEIEQQQIPATKPISRLWDEPEAYVAYLGLSNGQIIDYESRSSTEHYYRCVGNQK